MEGADLIRQLDQLKSGRGNWEQHWQEIGDLIWPDTSDFTVQRSSGEKRTRQVYESTATVALDRFAAAMESILTPKTQVWHHLKASLPELNNDPEVKEYFEAVNRVLFDQRGKPRTNYYGSQHEGYKSDGAYGTSCIWIENDPEEPGYRFRTDPLSAVYIATDAFGTVNIAYRKYRLTAWAATRQWKDNPNLPERIRKAQNPFDEFEFVTCIMPRDDYDEEAIMDNRGKPWVAYEVSVEQKVILQEAGFFEFPYVIGRYTRNAAEMYGRSPAMAVLPDIKTLQEQEKTFLRAGHRAVAPPLLLTHDGVLGAGGSRAPRIVPDGLNFGGLNERGEPLIKPLLTGMRLDLTEGMMEQKRKVINDAFLVTLFQILIENNSREMTATEVLQRAQEKGQLVAPLVSRQQAEKIGPQIDRELGLAKRAGLLPPTPQVLIEAKGEYRVVYDSPATRHQRIEHVQGFSRAIETNAVLFQNHPELLDIMYKPEVVIADSSEILGVPVTWMRTPDEQRVVRLEMQKAAQEQAEQEAIPEQARAAKDVMTGVAAVGR